MFKRGRKRWTRHGQISVEHLFMVLLAVLIIVPGTSLFYTYSKNSNHQMVSNQITRIGNEILKNAEVVYFLGKDSRIKMTLNFPRTMQSINISGEELSISFQSYAGYNEAVFFSDITLRGVSPGYTDILPEFHTGTVHLVIENRDNVIYITEDLG